MAISDYDSLVTEVQVYCARSDSVFRQRIPTFIALAEDRIYNGVGDNRDPMYSPAVRVKEMSQVATIPVVASVGQIPDRSLGLRRLSRASDTVGLDYLAPDAFAQRYSYPDAGQPRWYTIEGEDIRVAPAGWDGDLSVLYYARPTAITSSTPTNAVLTTYPNLYLTAALFEAFSFLKDGESAQGWLGRYRAAASGVNRSATGVRHGGGSLKSQPRVPMP